MDISKKSLNIKLYIAVAVFALMTAVNLWSFTKGYTDKIFLYSPEASNQTMYMPEFMEKGMYPDAFIRALVWDKTVEIPAEFNPYANYPSHGHDHTEDVGDGDTFFSTEYYYENNYGLFFKKYAKSIEINEDLPSVKETGELIDEEKREDCFTFLGYTNDMLRNTFLLNEDREYVNSYFHYTTYYYYIDKDLADAYFRAYLSPEDLTKTDTLIAIWDEKENLYLMSKEYFGKFPFL